MRVPSSWASTFSMTSVSVAVPMSVGGASCQAERAAHETLFTDPNRTLTCRDHMASEPCPRRNHCCVKPGGSAASA
jgi:hypothetical protein